MGYQTDQPGWKRVLGLAATQHGVVARQQLLALGISGQGIKHRVTRGKLHPIYRGVYALGRPELTADGRRMAALLACGPGAVLSHDSAAAFWGLRPREAAPEVTISSSRRVRVAGIRTHRSQALPQEQVVTGRGLAVTDLLRTLVDLAPRWGEQRIEDAIESADRRDLCDPERWRTPSPPARWSRASESSGGSSSAGPSPSPIPSSSEGSYPSPGALASVLR